MKKAIKEKSFGANEINNHSSKKTYNTTTAPGMKLTWQITKKCPSERLEA
jgi:hypothetical protein